MNRFYNLMDKLGAVCAFVLIFAMVIVFFRGFSDISRMARNSDTTLCLMAAIAGVKLTELPDPCQSRIKKGVEG